MEQNIAEEAQKWSRMAADVQTNVVEENVQTAMNWYREAAAQGNHDAQRRIGDYYRLGIGVQKDAEEAKQWYDRAALQASTQ